MLVYRIKNPEGLFSTGGSYPSFSKKGKMWRERSHLSNHLGLLNNRTRKDVYKDCVVVTYEVNETFLTLEFVEDYYVGIQERRETREAVRQQQYQNLQRESKLKQFEALKQELFGEKP